MWNDGRIYIGDWYENMMHGDGVYMWQDGRIYKGMYDKDKKNGYGIYLWADGKVYIGNWKDGQQDDEGCYVLPDGTVKKGLWKDKKRQQWLTVDEDEKEKMRRILDDLKQQKNLYLDQVLEAQKKVDGLH